MEHEDDFLTEGRKKLILLTASLLAIALLCGAAHATSNNGTFQITYSSSYAPGQQSYTHHGGYDWTLNQTWTVGDAMRASAGQFASWSFASQYFDLGSYTQSKSGTIKFYNNSARTLPYYKGEGTLTYTYLGSGTYGSLTLVMTTPLSSDGVGTTLYPTVSDSTLAGIGSTYASASGYSSTAGFMAPLNTGDGPVTGASFGYNYYVFSGNWQVDYTGVNGLVNSYTLTPRNSTYRYWVEASDGTILTPLTAFTGSNAAGSTIQRSRVFVQDPFANSTDLYFWLGTTPTYNLSMSPKNISPSQTSTALLLSSTGSFSDIGSLSYTCNPGKCYYNGGEPTFLYTGGTWKQWNASSSGYTLAYGAAFPGSLPLTFDTSGQIYITANLNPKAATEPGVSVSDTINVGLSGESKTLTINVREGVSNGLLSGATISLVNSGMNTWTNRTSETGTETFPIQKGSYYGWTATKAGYNGGDIVYNRFDSDATRDIILFKNTTLTNPGNASTPVWVIDSQTLKGISGATVWFGKGLNSNDVQQKTTPASGMVSFESLASTDYEIQASANGYEGTVVVYHTGAAGTTTSGVSLELVRKVAVTVEPTQTICDYSGCHAVTPVETEDPYPCNADNPEGCQRKQDDLAAFVTTNAQGLAAFFLVITLVCGFEMMGGRKK